MTLEELNLQNLQVINKLLTEELEQFRPTFEYDFEPKEQAVIVTMKLGGKTYYTSLNKQELDYFEPEDQAKEMAIDLLDPFKLLIQAQILPELIKISQNLAKLGE